MKKFVFVLLLAAIVAVPVSASTFVAMDLEEMTTRADAVVQGEIVEVESFWTESGRLIVTEATLRVEETLVGKTRPNVTIRTAGGEVGGLMVEAHGFPVFERGEKVLVFLKRGAAAGTVEVLGYQQGHYRVVTRLDGVTLAVPQAEEGFRALRKDGSLAPAASSVEIDQFKNTVRALAANR